MREGKQMNEFLANSRSRQKAGIQMAPIIEKIETEFTMVLDQARIIKDKANQVLKFETDKIALQKQIKQLRRDLNETNTVLASVKAEGQLTQSKQQSSLTTLKEEFHSLQRTINRRQDYFQSYDRKLGNVMETLSKNQAYINDRLYVFEEKFKQLSKETLEMTKEVKKIFDNATSSTLVLKSELTLKMRQTEEKQKILDLYMSERQEIPKKLHQIYEDLNNCLRQNEFQQFRTWHEKAVQESLFRTKAMLEQTLLPHAQQAILSLEDRFKQIDMMQKEVGALEEVKQQVEQLGMKLDRLEKEENHKLTAFRQETEEIEQKIIEVIDKKIETIEQEIQNFNIQNEETVDDKLDKLRQYLFSLINQSRQKLEKLQNKDVSVNNGLTSQQAALFTAQLTTAKKQREMMENQSNQIKVIAQGLNNKLSLFSNRITMCKSNIQIFSEATNRQLKKIAEIRKEEENHMQKVGALMADIIQSLLILTSLAIMEEAHSTQPKSFVTYHDGIILEIDKNRQLGTVNYRKFQTTSAELKQSLLFGLMNQVDSLTSGHSIFKCDEHRPSTFFAKIRENLVLKSKKANRSPSAHIVSPRRKNKKHEGDEDLFLDLKMESEEQLKASNCRPKINVNNSTLILTSQKPKSEMQIRYKLKKQEEKTRKEETQRNCFTASRSHRKTKYI